VLLLMKVTRQQRGSANTLTSQCASSGGLLMAAQLGGSINRGVTYCTVCITWLLRWLCVCSLHYDMCMFDASLLGRIMGTCL
jgi:hypothetical protein